MKKKVRWGVLGGANILQKVGPALDGANSELCAIATRSAQKREQLAKRYPGVVLYESYEELLQDGALDAVYIPLPNGLHHKWVLEAARHKKHILCEKTIAVTTAELQEMTEAAAENGVLLAEAFMLRYSQKFVKLAEILRSGVIGDVVNIQTSFYIPLANRQDIRYNRALGGGAMLDLGCYCLNLMLYVADVLAGKRTYPVAAENFATFENGVDVNHVGMMLFDKNITATFACGFNDANIPYRDSTFAQIIGTHGSIRMGQFMFPGELSVMTADKVQTHFFEETSYYEREIDTFSRAVRGEVDTLPMPIEESMRNLNLIQDLLNRRGYYGA